MLSTALFADTLITLAGGGTVRAHASHLFSRSLFFRTQLQRLVDEPQGTYHIDLRAFDINKEQLMIVLRYIYSRSLPDMITPAQGTGVTPLRMYQIADMMLEKQLAAVCMQQFAISLTADNFDDMADLTWTARTPS